MSKNIVLFDIESTNLKADFGYMLCFGWKNLGDKKTNCVSIDQSTEFHKDPTNDKYVTKIAYDVLSKADMIISWNGIRFDVPFINTRMLVHMPGTYLPSIPHFDGLPISRHYLRLHSNRLASVAMFLGTANKTPLDGPTWTRASAGHKPSLRYVVEHCRRDVEVLEQVYMRLRPFAQKHPNLSLMDYGPSDKLIKNEVPIICPVCGDSKLTKRGERKTRQCSYQRYLCSSCGHWSKGSKMLVKTGIS